MTTGIAGAAARTALQALVDRLAGGETREGQLEMAAAVADALKTGEHLVVEAGTGVGKSLAYLVAAATSGLRVVVATARKPLQDQLIRKDVPFVASAYPVEAAVLKGRSNYLCVAKLAEVAAGTADTQGRLITDARTAVLTRLARWVAEPEAGDLADAPVPVDPGLRSLVTVAAQECPGASQCRFGNECLAERALDRARSAQLVVTNIDLYCLDLVLGGGLLGEHDAVIVDEAHELEAIASRTLGLELGRRRLNWLAAQLRGLLVAGSEEPARLDRAGEHLAAALSAFAGSRVDPSDPAIAGVLAAADDAVADVIEVLRKLPDGGVQAAPAGDDPRRPRAVQAASSLLTDLRTARTPPDGQVAWVPEGTEAVLHLAPVDVGPILATLMHAKRTTILTSATLSVGGSLEPLAARLGLGTARRTMRVASPFDYRNQALLYCAAHLPDPRRPGFDAAALDELAGLVEAAGGRTLALFTSHRMLRLAAEAFRSRFPWTVLVQDGPPSPGLVEQFRDDEQACLLATMGYWQGVDVPGPSLTLVAVDRIPFPPLRDPLLDARRDAARVPFEAIDLPIAATLLAQGAGRLIRSTTDRGVVAVLDPRLARASYRPAILASLPRMRRTVDGAEVRRFLAGLVPAPPENADPASPGRH